MWGGCWWGKLKSLFWEKKIIKVLLIVGSFWDLHEVLLSPAHVSMSCGPCEPPVSPSFELGVTGGSRTPLRMFESCCPILSCILQEKEQSELFAQSPLNTFKLSQRNEFLLFLLPYTGDPILPWRVCGDSTNQVRNLIVLSGCFLRFIYFVHKLKCTEIYLESLWAKEKMLNNNA